AEDGIRDGHVTGVQTCALPILRQKGLALLEKARGETGLKVVTEVKDTETLPLVAESADLLQVGARNMQNFSLLEAVGDLRKPVQIGRASCRERVEGMALV